jgi:poly-beta-1,6-N-acetyl-D-glucosamine synthase
VKIALVVPFLDEEDVLGTLLASLAAQDRIPDRLVLVDDGSADGSGELAEAFAERHEWATVLRRPPRGPERDRLRGGGAIRAFQWGVERLEDPFDAVGKLDADLDLPSDFLAEMERRLEADADLGIVGAYVSQPGVDGAPTRLRCPPGHVLGATKLYRRECWEAVSPLPESMGWDTIDVMRANAAGWRTESFALASRDPVHVRPMGSRDGLLRGYRRAGAAAYGFGAGPVHLTLSALARLRDRPLGLAAAHFAAGWVQAAARRAPRATRSERHVVRRLRRERIKALVAARRRS